MTASLSPLLKQATPLMAIRGEGVHLYDVDGKRYLDFTSGIGVISTGHCHPQVVEAVTKQVRQLIHGQYTTVLHPRLLELTARLREVTPRGLDSFFFASAGTEAVEAAVRLAQQATGRTNVIAFQGGFHGRTAKAISLTSSNVSYRAGQQPLVSGTFFAPFPYSFRYGWSDEASTDFCIQEFDYLLATQTSPAETAAAIVEPVLGEGGYVPAPPDFLRELKRRCDAHGILLIVDEVQSGFGRTGRFWGHEHAGVAPDILVMAKGMGSGFPISALAASPSLMELGWAGSQGGTYGGNAVACAAAIATIDVIQQEGLVQNAAVLGDWLIGELRSLEDHGIGDVRGLGLMVGIEFVTGEGLPDTERVAAIRRAAFDGGLLLLPCGPFSNVLRWIPPLTVSREDLMDAIEIFRTALVSTSTGKHKKGQQAHV